MKNAADIFRFLIRAAEHGERTALVTVTDVIGGSSRAPGTHMAVSETGAFLGSLSGGCVEAAVVGEATRIIGTGQAELIRFGAGSRFIDIRLPCGGGLDLLIVPGPDPAVMARALSLLEQRLPVALSLFRSGAVRLDTMAGETGWRGDAFVAAHRPDLRLLIVGHGAETPALARLAQGYGAEAAVLSPDAAIVAAVQATGTLAHLLKTAAPSPHLIADGDCALVFLFHDHEWETQLLAQALEQEPFFIGAMGSRATHRRRVEALRRRGIGESDLARIKGPIGLIPATRDPDTLALSVLAQVVERHRAQAALTLPWTLADDGSRRMSA